MIIPKFDEITPATCRAISFRKKWPEFYEYLLNKYSMGTFQEKLALYYHQLNKIPVCVVCGNPVTFLGFKRGWRRTCCGKCQGKDQFVRDKVKQTCLERYGTENAAQSEQAKQKSKQTCLERYGTENAGWTEQSREKIIRTNRDRYGVDHPQQNETIRNKSKQTFQSKYGVRHNSQIQSVKESKSGKMLEKVPELRQKNMMRAVEKHEEIIGLDGDKYICICPHKECTKCTEKIYTISPGCYWSRTQSERCTKLLPENSKPIKNTSIEQFIKNILDEFDITYIENDRTLIKKELDIYCPDLHIAFECNGTFWHSTKFKSKNYHISKTELANSCGIKLYHIWEDWIQNEPDILRSMIIHWISKTPNKIRAHKCEIKEVLYNEARQFLNENHIQGSCRYSVAYGLYFENELVSLMTFSQKRLTKQSGWELTRFCTKLNYMIHGGANKLLQHFIKIHNPSEIYSYSSCDISSGTLYKNLGFISNGKVSQSYWYIEPKTHKRYHRSSFSKSRLEKLGWIDDQSMTETEIMMLHHYLQIYDSGTIKWIKQIPQE